MLSAHVGPISFQARQLDLGLNAQPGVFKRLLDGDSLVLSRVEKFRNQVDSPTLHIARIVDYSS